MARIDLLRYACVVSCVKKGATLRNVQILHEQGKAALHIAGVIFIKANMFLKYLIKFGLLKRTIEPLKVVVTQRDLHDRCH